MRSFTVPFVSLALSASVAVAEVPARASIESAREALNGRRFVTALEHLQQALSEVERSTESPQRSETLATLHFYVAVAALEVHDAERAREALRAHFAVTTKRDADVARYGSAFVELYAEVRTEKADEEGRPFADAYADPLRHEGIARPASAELFETSPEYQLLATPSERNEWKTLVDLDSRRRFVAQFWSSRDFGTGTSDNEFQQAFLQRISYADRHFSHSGLRGCLTDRGRVFVILGPPLRVSWTDVLLPTQRTAPTVASDDQSSANYSPLALAQMRTISQSAAPRAGEIAERWIYAADQLAIRTPQNGLTVSFVKSDGPDYRLQPEFFALKALRDAVSMRRIQ